MLRKMRWMRRHLWPTWAAVLVVLVMGCARPASGPSQDGVDAALLHPGELPGPSWSLVGMTDHPPRGGEDGNALRSARGAGPDCVAALTALDGVQPSPELYGRAVYRTPGPSGASDDRRHLALTIESSQQPSDRLGEIRAVATSCDQPMTIDAGSERVTVRVSAPRYTTPGAVGYSVDYATAGLHEHFDYAATTRGTLLVTTSVAGPSHRGNVALLEEVLAVVTARLGDPSPTSATGRAT